MAARPIITASAPDAANERDGNSVLHRADRHPVGAALVELLARAAVHRHKLHACRLRLAGELGRVEARMVPSQPHLEGHRDGDGLDRGDDQVEREIWLAHQGGAGQATGHFLGGATHVDVDDGGACGLCQASGLSHPVRIATGDLDDMGIDPLALGAESGFRFAPDIIVGGDHFRDDEGGSEASRDPSHADIRDSGHGREKGATGNRERSDHQRRLAHLLSIRGHALIIDIFVHCANFCGKARV
jgi:hypothetical protein